MSLSPLELSRYSRHIQLPQLGVAGQQKLRDAKVLVVGAGGLGSPAALYLAAAGVGTLGIADFDEVEAHNLQRQILHDESSIGRPKTASAAARLQQLNPYIVVREHPGKVDADNAVDLFSTYDVVLDGTDNFVSRYLNSDAAALARVPLVYGSVFMFSGQVSVFAPHQGGPCYRCLFPQPPDAGTVPNCGEAGVVGALCGVIGSLQAMEVIKLITGIGEPLVGQLLTYDALRTEAQTLRIPRDPACPVCGTTPQITRLDAAAYVRPSESPVMNTLPSDAPLEVDVQTAKSLLDQQPATTRMIDVREPFEWEICHVDGSEHIPLRQIPERVSTLPRDVHLLMLCHHGGRSERATRYLRQQGFTSVSNVAGGIDAWAREIQPSLARY